jgi:hypothetical protein
VKLVVWRTDPRISRSLPLTKGKIQTSGFDRRRGATLRPSSRRTGIEPGTSELAEGPILWCYIMMR